MVLLIEVAISMATMLKPSKQSPEFCEMGAVNKINFCAQLVPI